MDVGPLDLVAKEESVKGKKSKYNFIVDYYQLDATCDELTSVE